MGNRESTFCVFSRLDASVPGGGEPAADDDPVAPGQGGGRQRENDQRFYCRAFISHIKTAENIIRKIFGSFSRLDLLPPLLQKVGFGDRQAHSEVRCIFYALYRMFKVPKSTLNKVPT